MHRNLIAATMLAGLLPESAVCEPETGEGQPGIPSTRPTAGAATSPVSAPAAADSAADLEAQPWETRVRGLERANADMSAALAASQKRVADLEAQEVARVAARIKAHVQGLGAQAAELQAPIEASHLAHVEALLQRADTAEAGHLLGSLLLERAQATAAAKDTGLVRATGGTLTTYGQMKPLGTTTADAAAQAEADITARLLPFGLNRDGTKIKPPA